MGQSIHTHYHICRVPADIPFSEIEGNVKGLADSSIVHVVDDISIIQAGSSRHFETTSGSNPIENCLVVLLQCIHVHSLHSRGNSFNYPLIEIKGII